MVARRCGPAARAGCHKEVVAPVEVKRVDSPVSVMELPRGHVLRADK
jgi:hypothetical protein